MRPAAPAVFVLAVACGTDAAPGMSVDTAGAGFASWPMPNPGSTPLPNPARLSVMGDVVRDDVTGLLWQRGFGALTTWSEARSRCTELRAAGGGGWRLPARIELVSLVDTTRRPTVDVTAFPDTPADYFWSSSPLRRDPTFAFSVYFGLGETSFGAVNKAGAHVRCVRGSVPAATPAYDIGDDQVFDRATRLRWQRRSSPVQMSAVLADAHCRDVQLAGAAGFRVPSAKELETIVDDRRSAPAVDGAAFPDTPAAPFWTVTTTPDPNANARHLIDFADGTTVEDDPSAAHWVRCVR